VPVPPGAHTAALVYNDPLTAAGLGAAAGTLGLLRLARTVRRTTWYKELSARPGHNVPPFRSASHHLVSYNLWTDGGGMITAIVLIKTERGRTPEVAQALIGMPGISEAYSVAGDWDLVAIARVRQHDDLADLVSARVQSIDGIQATNTLIAFRAYSQRDLEAMWDVGNEERLS